MMRYLTLGQLFELHHGLIERFGCSAGTGRRILDIRARDLKDHRVRCARCGLPAHRTLSKRLGSRLTKRSGKN